jgi:hypothetical protein
MELAQAPGAGQQSPVLLDWMFTQAAMPEWLFLLMVGIILAARIGFAGYVLARAGFSPLWSLVLLVPLADIPAIWIFAYARWPRYRRAEDLTSR